MNEFLSLGSYCVLILLFEFGYDDSVFLIVTIIMDIVALLFCVSAAFSSAQDAQVDLFTLFFSSFLFLSPLLIMVCLKPCVYILYFISLFRTVLYFVTPNKGCMNSSLGWTSPFIWI
jgi:hypothetical protein